MRLISSSLDVSAGAIGETMSKSLGATRLERCQSGTDHDGIGRASSSPGRTQITRE